MTPKEILEKLNIKFSESTDRMFGTCPIHGGDNSTAFSMFKESGHWTCFTHGCQEQHGNSIFGFTKAIMAKAANVPVINFPNKEVRDFLELEQKNPIEFIPKQLFEFSLESHNAPIMSKQRVHELLNVASPYYLRRGFLPETLLRFNVSELSSANLMRNRAIVPIFDTSGESMIGFSGRSTTSLLPKWLHSPGFKRNLSLYNSWNVIPGGTLILTEGFAKVWRLEEAGIQNSVAIYGTHLGESQIGLINSIGPQKIFILMDNDEPGKIAARTIQKKLLSFYKTIILETSIVDVDQTPVDQVKRILCPLLEKK